MNLMNLMVKDIIPFAAANDLDLLFIIKFIDYRLATIDIDITNSFEVDTYITNVRTLNSLIILMGITTNYSDAQRKAYDNEVLMKAIEEDFSRLIKYRQFKLNVIVEQCKDLIFKFDEYLRLESSLQNE
jgi:hypothetical protein